MKQKNLWAVIVIAVLSLSMIGIISAHDATLVRSHDFVDSNTVITLTVDSADWVNATIQADTVYYPSSVGKNFGWMDQLLLRYGVAFLDSSASHVYAGSIEDDSGHCFEFAAGNDSGHIGVALETSIEGASWVIAFEDSTIRAAASSRTTNSHLMDVSGMISDTLIGNRARVRLIMYRDVDSTEANKYHIRDTVWLDRIRLMGFGFEE